MLIAPRGRAAKSTPRLKGASAARHDKFFYTANPLQAAAIIIKSSMSHAILGGAVTLAAATRGVTGRVLKEHRL
jgi:hypothetical protein